MSWNACAWCMLFIPYCLKCVVQAVELPCRAIPHCSSPIIFWGSPVPYLILEDLFSCMWPVFLHFLLGPSSPFPSFRVSSGGSLALFFSWGNVVVGPFISLEHPSNLLLSVMTYVIPIKDFVLGTFQLLPFAF